MNRKDQIMDEQVLSLNVFQIKRNVVFEKFQESKKRMERKSRTVKKRQNQREERTMVREESLDSNDFAKRPLELFLRLVTSCNVCHILCPVWLLPTRLF